MKRILDVLNPIKVLERRKIKRIRSLIDRIVRERVVYSAIINEIKRLHPDNRIGDVFSSCVWHNITDPISDDVSDYESVQFYESALDHIRFAVGIVGCTQKSLNRIDMVSPIKIASGEGL